MTSFEHAEKAFKEAAEEVAGAKLKWSAEEQLQISGVYYQSLYGDFVSGKTHNKQYIQAWKSHAGQSKEDAQAEFVELIKDIMKKYGFQDKIQGF